MARSYDLLSPPIPERFHISDLAAAELTAQCALVITHGDSAPIGDHAAARSLGAGLLDALASMEPATSAGSVVKVPMPTLATGGSPALLVLVGIGGGTRAELRRGGAAAARAALGHDRVVHAPSAAQDWDAYLEGALLGGWAPPTWTAAGVVESREAPKQLDLVAVPDPEVAERAVIRVQAQLFARGLAATPANLKSPQWLADAAASTAQAHGLQARVWATEQLRDHGFGGLEAVGSGSARPPRLAVLSYPGADGAPHVVLVGKGIVFDSGGLNLKPADSMGTMKTDMAGAASVLAVIVAAARLGVRPRITALLPLAENAVSGTSYRPGDVIAHVDGQTSEVGNTDAEGRIVLADALAYAAATLDPDILVDVATLTGAARMALGRTVAPVFATDDELASDLRAAGEIEGEALWRMPLVEAYREALDSDVADLNNAGAPIGAGAITAALFLRAFVGGRRWAHLDIAGAGRSDSDTPLATKGATGFSVRTLVRWLEDMS